jgi:Fur family ferric uptake transcriptional regulator
MTALRQAGYRQTQSRAAILQVLESCDDWLDVEAVHQRAKALCPGLGLVTVYRTLALLTGLGLVRRIHHEDGCHGYARAGYTHGHHLVCRDCHTVVEFPGGDDLGSLIRRLEGATGFAIENHLLELLGVCPACQRGSIAA